MLKSPTSRWTAGAVGLCAALLVLTYLVLVSPRRADADALGEQTAAAEQANSATQLRTAQLRALYATLPQRRQELTTMLAQLPVTADVPGFVRSLDSLAHSSGVVLDGVTPSAGAYVSVDGPGAARRPRPPGWLVAPAGGHRRDRRPGGRGAGQRDREGAVLQGRDLPAATAERAARLPGQRSAGHRLGAAR